MPGVRVLPRLPFLLVTAALVLSLLPPLGAGARPAVSGPSCNPQFSGSWNPSEVDATQTVWFHGNLTGVSGCVGGSFTWQFGDGGGSSQVNTSHVYSTASGSFPYTVGQQYTSVSPTGTWVFAGGSIMVDPLPAVSLTLRHPEVDAGTADLVCYDDSGGPAGPYGDGTGSVSVDFGDISPQATGLAPLQTAGGGCVSHTYASAGSYGASATYTDGTGASGSGSLTVRVSPALTASTSASTTSPAPGDTVSFSGAGAGGSAPYAYSWSSTDEWSSTAQNPSHAFASAGTYIVTLTVTDSAGATATSQVAVSVAASPVSGSMGGVDWGLVAIGLGAVVVAVGGAAIAVRAARKRRPPSSTAPPPTSYPEFVERPGPPPSTPPGV